MKLMFPVMRFSARLVAALILGSVVSYANAEPLGLPYTFGEASFKTDMWINKKAVFSKPKNINVEFTSAGAFDWVFADATGKEVKKVRHSNAHGGWTSVNLPSLGLYGDYSVGFRNASGSEQHIKQGTVEP
jgi:hypothetical protein